MNKFIAILLFFSLNFTSFSLAENLVNARTAIVVDYHSDKILYELDPDAQIYPASMTKIMTTIVAFDLIENKNFHWMINLLFLKMLGDFLKVVIHLCLLW
tara:strand:- start:281 stop:580 length:300 start_codon:yes stop_codon:yes gene_type:complete